MKKVSMEEYTELEKVVRQQVSCMHNTGLMLYKDREEDVRYLIEVKNMAESVRSTINWYTGLIIGIELQLEYIDTIGKQFRDISYLMETLMKEILKNTNRLIELRKQLFDSETERIDDEYNNYVILKFQERLAL